MKKIFLAALLLLTSCATVKQEYTPDYCRYYFPVYYIDEVEIIATPENINKQIYFNNKNYKNICALHYQTGEN